MKKIHFQSPASKVNKPAPSTTAAPLTESKVKSNPKLKLINDTDDLDEDEGETDGESDEGTPQREKKRRRTQFYMKNVFHFQMMMMTTTTIVMTKIPTQSLARNPLFAHVTVHAHET